MAIALHNMLKLISLLAAVFLAGSTFAAELTFDFSQFAAGTTPTGFVSTVTGKGKPGDWKIFEDEIPAALAPLSPNAPKTGKRRVLAQLSQDPTDEHFPLFIFDNER